MALALGDAFTLVLTEDGILYAFGANQRGQLGLGHIQQQIAPMALDRLLTFEDQDIVMVAAGANHAACVSQDGSVWTWGDNGLGALGLGGVGLSEDEDKFEEGEPPYFGIIIPKCSPTRISSEHFGRAPALMVACGTSFSVLLTAAGHVWTAGYAGNGQLGHNDEVNRQSFTLVDPEHFGGTAIGMVATGNSHSMALSREGGMLWAWGSHLMGELGLGLPHTYRVHVPTLVPAVSFGNVAVASMDGGSLFSMVVTVDGVLWGCGHGAHGELGNGSKRHHRVMQRVGGAEYFGGFAVRSALCGLSRCVITTEENAVWTCGNDGFPVMSARAWPGPDTLRPIRLERASFDNADVVIAGSGRMHSAAVTARGRLYTWGVGHNFDNGCGLGYYSAMGQGSPRALTVGLPVFDLARIGRWHDLRQAHILAFSMGLHARLGADSAFRDTPAELVREMFERMRFSARHGSSPGYQNLIGRMPR